MRSVGVCRMLKEHNTSPRLVATLPFIACVLFSLPTVHVGIMVLYDDISCITQ